jgi:predicted O-methyltransferase YrrM
MTEMIIEQLLKDKPAFHAWPDGTPANWSVAGDVLRFLTDLVKPGMNTLETGAGQTTVVFAVRGANHVCITPDTAQAERIRAYLEPLGTGSSVRFIHQSSDEALPSGCHIPERLDLVLIDGAHRFPFPILDWYYTQARVPVGGMMIVDDIRMPSVRILYDFLNGEDEWELVTAFEVTAAFRRVKETVCVWDWADQRINKPHLDRISQKAQNGSESKDLLSVFKVWLGRGS